MCIFLREYPQHSDPEKGPQHKETELIRLFVAPYLFRQKIQPEAAWEGSVGLPMTKVVVSPVWPRSGCEGSAVGRSPSVHGTETFLTVGG